MSSLIEVGMNDFMARWVFHSWHSVPPTRWEEVILGGESTWHDRNLNNSPAVTDIRTKKSRGTVF